MKRIITMVMVLCMALLTFTSVGAEGRAEISISAEKGSGSFYVNQPMGGRVKVEVTDKIIVSINIANAFDADVCSGVLYIKYDSEAVDCLGYKSVTGGSWEVNDSEIDSLRMAFSKSDAIDDGAVFAAAFDPKTEEDITFRVEVEELLTGDVIDGDVPADYMFVNETVTYSEGAGDTLLMGDANLDNKVNTADAVEVLKHSASITTLEGKAFTQGNVNYDGVVNTADAVLILKYVAGMIANF